MTHYEQTHHHPSESPVACGVNHITVQLCAPPAGVTVNIFELDGLPAFNEDDEKNPPAKVVELKKQIRGPSIYRGVSSLTSESPRM